MFGLYVHELILDGLGLTKCENTEDLFVLENDRSILCHSTYFDDLFVVDSDKEILNDFMNKLGDKFKLNISSFWIT